MRVADYIFERLADEGISKAYTVTGRGALFLTDGLAKSQRIDAVCTHHEQSAGYAAVAESQLKNDISLCIVSTGCASTNGVTPVLNAWQDGLPVIFISGQNILKETTTYTGLNIRTYGQQEANIVDIVKSITKYSVMVTDAKSVPNILEEAIHKANSGKKGPVWIDIPLCIQSAQIEPEISYVPTEEIKTISCIPELTELEKSLASSRRPVIMIGSGIRSSNSIDKLKDFVETNKIPVVFSASAVDTYPTSNILSIGSIGSMGTSRAGAFTVQNADLLVVLGNRLPSIVTGVDFCKFARNAKTFVIDIDPIEHSKESVEIDTFIQMDLNNFFDHFKNSNLKREFKDWNAKTQHWKKVFSEENIFSESDKVDLYSLCNELSKNLSKDAIVITDSGFIEVILPTNINFGPNRRAIHPVSQGAMGFALPAILGSYDKEASNRQIVCVVGDGSIMMNLQELQTIKHHNIPVKIIVINNNIYSIIRRRQKELFRKRTIGTGIEDGVSVPDFKKLANAFDFDYSLIANTSSLSTGLHKVLKSDHSVLCEIIGRDDQQYIEVSHAKSSSGKYVRRPLEDQWPFLDRDKFLEEMVIDPIDQ
jgi:acetolactate synthase I/II/III large subunit